MIVFLLHKSITVCLLYKSTHISRIMVPIDAAEFDAHKNINTVIIQFLCHNKGKGFSAKEIADAVGIKERS